MQQVSMAKSIKNDMWISDEDKLNQMLPVTWVSYFSTTCFY